MGLIEHYWVFVTVTFVLMVTPGPAVVLAISNGLLHGPKSAAFAIVGNMTGFIISSGISVIGLSFVLQYSSAIFEVVKWLGGSYLIFLGIRMYRTKRERVGVREQIDSLRKLSPMKLYLRGLIVTLSNPKALAFLVAFFPQFLNLNEPLLRQYLVLVGTMLIFQGSVLLAYAYLSSRIRDWLNSSGRLTLFNKISGVTFIGFGVSLFMSSI